MSTYELRLTIHDNQPGRARVKARADLIDSIGGVSALVQSLHDRGFTLEHGPEVAEQIHP